MEASAIEFRLRMAINAVIIILGFWAPWIEAWGIGKRIPSSSGSRSNSAASASHPSASQLLPSSSRYSSLPLAAAFRISGAAYLGPGTVNSINMVAGNVMADGPYRFVRNPLYIGLWCMVAAIAFLMPVPARSSRWC